VLIDEGSASAAEMLTTGLKDNRSDPDHVFSMGDTTYGKARGQILGSTPAGGIVRITFMTMTTKNGVDYNQVGLPPDTLLNNDSDWLDIAWQRAHAMAGLPRAKLPAGSHAHDAIALNRRLLGAPRPERLHWVTLPAQDN